MTDSNTVNASAAHAALQNGVPQAGSAEAAALVALARATAAQAAALASGNAVTALAGGARVLSALGSALGADAARRNDANLATAAAVVTGLSTAAGQVTTLLQSGLPLPLALANAAVTTLLPTGTGRSLALGVIGALAYSEASQDTAYTAGQQLLGVVAGFASDYAGQADPGGQITPQAYAAKFALPVLGYLAGGAQPGAAKYLPGAYAQTALDLLFVGTPRSNQ